MVNYFTKLQNCSPYLIFSLAGKELVRMIKKFSLSNEPIPIVHSERLRGCKTKSGHMCFLLRLFPSMCFLNGAFHSGRNSQSQASILSMFPKQQPHVHPSAFSVQQGWTPYHLRPQVLLWYKLSSGLLTVKLFGFLSWRKSGICLFLSFINWAPSVSSLLFQYLNTESIS